MRRRLRRLSSGRLMSVRWTVRRAVGLSGGASLVAAVVIVVLLATGVVSPGVPACEAAMPAAPNFEAAPFAFDPEAKAYSFVEAFSEGDFKTAYGMARTYPEYENSPCGFALEELRAFYTEGRPPMVGVEHPATAWAFDPSGNELHLKFRLLFEGDQVTDAAVYVSVALQRDGRAAIQWPDADLRIRAAQGPVKAFPVPTYADRSTFEESATSIGSVPWTLDATLTIPHGPGPFPAVVLVPGDATRYTDRDATVGASKPLRDLAWGLGTRGIASIRYDPRMRRHALAAARQPGLTLSDEYVDDALAAVAALRDTPRIALDQVYVLGLTHGGFAGPRIAQQDPSLAGLILYTAPSGTLWEGILQHAHYRHRADRQVTEVERNNMRFLRARAAAAEAAASGIAVRDLSVHPAYHQYLAGYRPEEAARDLPMSILVIDGALTSRGRAPFEGWLQNLHQRPDTVFRLYPKLGRHLFDVDRLRYPEGRQLPESYPQHVAPEVIDDIAKWIDGERPELICAGATTWLAGCRGAPDSRVDGLVAGT